MYIFFLLLMNTFDLLLPQCVEFYVSTKQQRLKSLLSRSRLLFYTEYQLVLFPRGLVLFPIISLNFLVSTLNFFFPIDFYRQFFSTFSLVTLPRSYSQTMRNVLEEKNQFVTFIQNRQAECLQMKRKKNRNEQLFSNVFDLERK